MVLLQVTRVIEPPHHVSVALYINDSYRARPALQMGYCRQPGTQGLTEQHTDDLAVRDQHYLLACVPYDDSLERRDRTLSHFLKCLTARGTCCDRALLPALVQFR